MRYKDKWSKKVVEAVKWDGNIETINNNKWLEDAIKDNKIILGMDDIYDKNPVLLIQHNDTVLKVERDYYVIKEVNEIDYNIIFLDSKKFENMFEIVEEKKEFDNLENEFMKIRKMREVRKIVINNEKYINKRTNEKVEAIKWDGNIETIKNNKWLYDALKEEKIILARNYIDDKENLFIKYKTTISEYFYKVEETFYIIKEDEKIRTLPFDLFDYNFKPLEEDKKMKILRLDRGKGKTIQLIKLSNEKWINILCLNRFRVKYIKELAENIGLNIPEPIVLEDIKQLDNNNKKEILIDDIENVLEKILGIRVSYVTTSCEIIDKI